MKSCNHDEFEIVGHDYYIDEEQSMVEVVKYFCLGCSRQGEQLTVTKQIKWFDDPNQTKLPILP